MSYYNSQQQSSHRRESYNFHKNSNYSSSSSSSSTGNTTTTTRSPQFHHHNHHNHNHNQNQNQNHQNCTDRTRVYQNQTQNHQNFYKPRPPPSNFRPNFVIQLRSNQRNFNEEQVRLLLDRCTPQPDSKFLFPSQFIAATLQFRQWRNTLDAIVFLWEERLKGCHFLFPFLISSITAPSDKDDVKNGLKTLFENHVKGLLRGELVQRWSKKLEITSNEIENIETILRRRRGVKLNEFEGFQRKKEGLVKERELIKKRLEEFEAAMGCVLAHVDGSRYNVSCEDELKLNVLRFPSELDWNRIHFVILRECRRLEDGLPIYSFRRDILNTVYSQQVMVLIGETGSGKSTQLVQFLADSGLPRSGSIICTQPRKIAAISLAQRVGEESNGCYIDNSVICYPSFSSAQGFKSKIIFMTDHCLLQHYMNDQTLDGITYIIVDEAHERSLNTDLLLALLKSLLLKRLDLRLIIMSATADACKLSDYFFGCGTYHVVGRKFPVIVKYAPCVSGAFDGIWQPSISKCPAYVSDVVKTVNDIHKTEKEGAILAFLTSQAEVEWACENFKALSAVALPLHGKLSPEEQGNVFKSYKERKVVFATNVAETSLTIPGVKYVVDCGLAKESRFEPSTGMNVLRVCRISQSSADQRSGRAGRTEPGNCYRLYSEEDFQLMPSHQDPEIRKVHLGIAVLRIIALGIKNVRDFDFIDAPSPKSIDMAIDNLIHLGAIVCKNGALEFTEDGRSLVKLGVEPRLGKLILESLHHRLCKEGIVLAAVMANASTIFCRVGNDENKLKSDCLKVPFCHRDGDLFTLLSVYKAWESVPMTNQSKWCFNNSINAKSMRRCKETVQELENCLKNELQCIIPNYWLWNPDVPSQHDKALKKIILSSLPENVAMYSGYDRLGYEVALTGQYVELHPSCSLLIYSEKPKWVVYGEVFSASSHFLVCVTAVDYDCLHTLPPSILDVSEMEKHELLVTVRAGFGTVLLKRFCGKANGGLLSLVSRVRNACMDEHIGIEVDVDKNEIQLFSSSKNMEKVTTFVDEVLQYEARWLRDECNERGLYRGGHGTTPSVALVGAGGEIRHLELEKRYLTVEVSHSNARDLNDKELLMMFDKRVSGICGFHKNPEGFDSGKWGKITFLTPEAAEKAVAEMNDVELNGSVLKVSPSRTTLASDKHSTYPAVKARVCWPRKISKGYGFVKCAVQDIGAIIRDLSGVAIQGRPVKCDTSEKGDCVVVWGIDKEICQQELLEIFSSATCKKITDVHLVRGNPVDTISIAASEEALSREIATFIPSKNTLGSNFHVQVFPPEPKDYMMKAAITFDGRLHLEAAMALDHIQWKVLSGCHSWQKIECQHMFHSSVSCPAPVYSVIRPQLDSLIDSFKHRNGVQCDLVRHDNGSYRVRISANATKTVADIRRPFEQILQGKRITHSNLTPAILQLLFSRAGTTLLHSMQQETGTYILYDRQTLNVKIFGPPEKLASAEFKLVGALLLMNENRQHEIRLRGKGLPHNLMKEVVTKFGPDLYGLKGKLPFDVELTLSTRRHALLFRGDKEAKQKLEEIVHDVAKSLHDKASEIPEISGDSCPICLCEVDDCYQLEDCCHRFCRLCLVEQCESAIKSHEGFPLRCTYEKCGCPILLVDLRTLLLPDKLEELFRASLSAYVASSAGTYRFCPSPDCPGVYKTQPSNPTPVPFVCGACHVETCTRCHLEYHPYISCEMYKEFKDDPDSSLKEWKKGKEQVKGCPVCGYTIEKVDGCNHIECKCGKHICWVCLKFFEASDDCYDHLRTIHLAIV